VKGDADLPNRIDTTLANAREAGRSALGPYITVGYPDVPTSTDIAEAVLESGADMLELGIPFSDPLAEGPTIQKSSFHALQQGVTMNASLDVLRDLRQRGVDSPLIFMGYINPFLAYGMERFARDAAAAGLDGVILPDLPAEESTLFADILEENGIYLVPLLAPTSSDTRIERACSRARGFIYCVSLTGVTGARSELRQGIEDMVGRVRQFTDLPLMVGFGISRREHVESVSRFADGVMVGSALIDAIGNAPEGGAVEAARELVKALRLPAAGECDT
jgi:tryptophan synthase alpha chain